MSDVEVHVYEPLTGRVPPVRPYLRDVWSHRQWAFYVARADLKARHVDTWFGQAWTVINPLLLGLVYFLLVNVIADGERGFGFFVTLIGSLFAFYYTRNAVGSGATAVSGSGSLVTSSTLPRALLPISAAATALLLYVPTLLVYLALHLAAVGTGDRTVTISWLALPVLLVLQTLLNVGLALGLSALNVYFRDTQAFLPYMTRIWLYVSPVIYRLDDVDGWIRTLLLCNPLTPVLAGWQQVLADGQWPEAWTLLAGAGWALVALVVGGRIFIGREREFAVRL